MRSLMWWLLPWRHPLCMCLLCRVVDPGNTLLFNHQNSVLLTRLGVTAGAPAPQNQGRASGHHGHHWDSIPSPDSWRGWGLARKQASIRTENQGWLSKWYIINHSYAPWHLNLRPKSCMVWPIHLSRHRFQHKTPAPSQGREGVKGRLFLSAA